MSIDQALSMAKEALTVAFLVAAPCLGISMVVGFVISIFQATTQIHDQTLSFVPKIVAVAAGLLLCGGWMLRTLVSFAQRIMERLASLP